MTRRAFLRLSGGGGYLFLLTACSVKAAPPATNGQPERSMPPPTAIPTAAHAQSVLTPVAATASPVATPTILHPQEPAHTPAALSPTPAVTGVAQMVIGAYTVSKDETGTSFLGYLVNTGKVACEGIQVAATLQDAGGRAIATQTSYDVRDIVLPGERSPFAVNFDNGVVWAKEELHVVAQVLDPGGLWHRAKGLSLTDIVATPANPAQKRSYYISGLVRNAGSAPAVLVEIFGIAYDTAGRPIDVNSAKVFALQINPGQTSRFALEFPRVKTEPAHYDLYVQGHIPH